MKNSAIIAPGTEIIITSANSFENICLKFSLLKCIAGYSASFMILGFLGTGRISSSVIEGIFKSKLKIKKIYISPRNKIIAKKLNKRFKSNYFKEQSTIN